MFFPGIQSQVRLYSSNMAATCRSATLRAKPSFPRMKTDVTEIHLLVLEVQELNSPSSAPHIYFFYFRLKKFQGVGNIFDLLSKSVHIRLQTICRTKYHHLGIYSIYCPIHEVHRHCLMTSNTEAGFRFKFEFRF